MDTLVRILGNQTAAYEAWKISFGSSDQFAFAQRKIRGVSVEITLRRFSSTIPLQGWYGDEPSAVWYALGGICILCECYGFQLDGADVRTSAPPFLSPCNHHNRQVIERYLSNGHVLTVVHMPTELCVYHTTLVAAQVEIATQKEVREMAYHLPRKEYHADMEKTEQMIGKRLPGLHRRLDGYADMLESFVRETFRRAGITVHIIDPFEPGMDQNDAYLLPYLDPERFGLDPSSLIAIEDLVELRLAMEARQRGAPAFSVWGGVLGFPSPYRQRGVAKTTMVYV